MTELTKDTVLSAFDFLKWIGCTHFYQERGSSIILGVRVEELGKPIGFRLGCNEKIVNLVVEEYDEDNTPKEKLYVSGAEAVSDTIKTYKASYPKRDITYKIKHYTEIMSSIKSPLQEIFNLSLD